MDEAGRLAELEMIVARLQAVMTRLQAEMALKDQVIIEQLARIGELERALEESRRGGKR